MKNIATKTLFFAFLLSTCLASADDNTGSVIDIDGNVYATVKIENQVWTVENLRTTKYNDGTSIPLVTDSAVSEDNDTGTVTDIDGNVYQTVKIGNQVWTVENLRTTKYNDGTPIPLVTDQNAWYFLRTPGYCWYDNDIKNKSKYGALYNWFAVDTEKLAPLGWHVPTELEWDTLQNYLIANGYNWDGTTTDNKIAKSLAAKTDWETDVDAGTIGNDLTKNNRIGFSALPGGYRVYRGDFHFFGYYGFWWSAAEIDASSARYRILSCGIVSLLRYFSFKKNGFSVRLLRD